MRRKPTRLASPKMAADEVNNGVRPLSAMLPTGMSKAAVGLHKCNALPRGTTSHGSRVALAPPKAAEATRCLENHFGANSAEGQRALNFRDMDCAQQRGNLTTTASQTLQHVLKPIIMATYS